jgi:hypothetical protein
MLIFGTSTEIIWHNPTFLKIDQKQRPLNMKKYFLILHLVAYTEGLYDWIVCVHTTGDVRIRLLYKYACFDSLYKCVWNISRYKKN